LFVLLLLALLAISFVSSVSAQEEGDSSSYTGSDEEGDEAKRHVDDEDEDYDELTFIPHPDVSVSFLFPDAPDRRLKLGETANILAGFHNKADQAFNITGIGAHLQSPFDLSYYIMNFTARRVVGASVGPMQQASVEYQFRPDPSLEPTEYWLSAWVIYNNSDDQVFMHTFYNGTVELVEEDGGFGAKQALFYLVVLASFGAAAYGIVRYSGFKVGEKKKKVDRSRQTESFTDIPIYRPKESSQARRRK